MHEKPDGERPKDPAAPVAVPDKRSLIFRALRLARKYRKLLKEFKVLKAVNEGLNKVNMDLVLDDMILKDDLKTSHLEIEAMFRERDEDRKSLNAAYDHFERKLQEAHQEAREAKALAQQAKTEVEIVKTEAEVELAKAKRDSLDSRTQLPRDGYFNEQLQDALQFERRALTYVLVEFDLSPLHDVNREINEDMGDRMITRAAKIIKSEMRSEIVELPAPDSREPDQRQPLIDLKARYGGDEFMTLSVLGPDIPESNYLENGRSIVERCCSQFDLVQWTKEYPEWKRPRKPEAAKSIKPRLDAGVVFIRTGPIPRIYTGSSRDHRKKLITMVSDDMVRSKEYRKLHDYRRVFYTEVEFRDRRMKITNQGFWDMPLVKD